MMSLRKSQNGGRVPGVYKGDDSNTSSVVRQGEVHQGLRKKGEGGGACVHWDSEGPA
jgi:hypothetical protein